MNPANWDGGTWIAVLGTVGGFMAWMTALWVRAGRILERIDCFSGTQAEHGRKLDNHEGRITRLEIVTEEK